MARISIYNAFVWLGTIHKSGYDIFTIDEIKRTAGYNHGYLLALINKGYIVSHKKIPAKQGTNKINVWKMNESIIRTHKFGNIVYDN